MYGNPIRIYHECKGRIEKSIPREGFFYPTLTGIIDLFLAHHCFWFLNKLQEVPEYAKMQLHMMTSLKHNNDVFDDLVREFKYNQCM